MTPHEFTAELMCKLKECGFFQKALLVPKVLCQKIMNMSVHNSVSEETCVITKLQLDQCILEATSEFVDEALLKYSEMGLLTIRVAEDGTIQYHKNIARAIQLGYV